ncbi:MAG: hypothetical protein NZ455_15530 [Bacteroidia bacterium]|nr:hypothetical protein [Bacteroidia bacterium]
MILLFGRVPRFRSGRCIPHYASLRCFANASHCLTACSMPLTQMT